MLEVCGQLSDVVEDLHHAVLVALADGPRGVVCDLSAVKGGTEPAAVEVLAALGGQVRDWPGIPVAVACPDLRVRQSLAAHPPGGHLIVTASLFSAVGAVLATPEVRVEWLHLAPHPTALRASRDFVTRTLLDWRLDRAIRFARLVVSELVMSSTVNAGTNLDVSVAWNLGALRLTVRDYVPSHPPQASSTPGLHGRGLALVSGLSQDFGVLPTSDGGTVVWAVLDAPCNTRPFSGASPHHVLPQTVKAAKLRPPRRSRLCPSLMAPSHRGQDTLGPIMMLPPKAPRGQTRECSGRPLPHEWHHRASITPVGTKTPATTSAEDQVP